MVAHSRTSLRPYQLRPLNTPHPIDVSVNKSGHPIYVNFRGRTRAVTKVKDQWRIDDEWWRKPISRLYYSVEYADGTPETIYFDLVNQRWYKQRVSYVR